MKEKFKNSLKAGEKIFLAEEFNHSNLKATSWQNKQIYAGIHSNLLP